MKIIGKDGKNYNTIEECLEADKKFDEALQEKEEQEKEIKNLLKAKRKEKADAVKAADEALSLAQAELYKAREEARKIIEAAQQEAKEILKKHIEEYEKVADKKYKALRDFNDHFGAYTTTYTGQQALEEYNRAVKDFMMFFQFPF